MLLVLGKMCPQLRPAQLQPRSAAARACTSLSAGILCRSAAATACLRLLGGPLSSAVQMSCSRRLCKPVCRHTELAHSVQISSNKGRFKLGGSAPANASAALACRPTSPLHRSLSATAACSGGLTTCSTRRTAQASLPRSTSGSPASGRPHRLLQLPPRSASVLMHSCQLRQTPTSGGTVEGPSVSRPLAGQVQRLQATVAQNQ